MKEGGWEAPKAGKDYPNEVITVSARPYEEILREISLAESELSGKTIVSIGNGLSDFVAEAGKSATVFGVDPIYNFLDQDLKHFNESLSSIGLSSGLKNYFFFFPRD